MSNAFDPNHHYVKSIINFIVNVYCPNEKFSEIVCVRKMNFLSLGRGDNQCQQRASKCQTNNNSFEKWINSLLLLCDYKFYYFADVQKSNIAVVGDDYRPLR